MATEFTQLDARFDALRETGKAPVRYLLGQVAGAAAHLIGRACARSPQQDWEIREDPDRLGYYWARRGTYSLVEVFDLLQKTWDARLSSQPSDPYPPRATGG